MSARKIALHARMEYSLWLTNPRMSILLVLLTLIHSMAVQPLAQAGRQIGARFHLLEPLAALCNSTLILLCQRRYEIVRKRRRNFVIFRRRGVTKIRYCLAQKECSRFAVSGA